MVDLLPTAVDIPEYPAGANGQRYFFSIQAEVASFSAYSIKHLGRFVDGVIKILDVNLSRTVKDMPVNRLNLSPAALNATQRIVHRNVI